MRRAQRGMSRKGHFVTRSEDANPRRGALRGQDEGGLGEVELARERLHRGVVDATTILEDTEGIATETQVLTGEDVDDPKAKRGHAAFSCNVRHFYCDGTL